MSQWPENELIPPFKKLHLTPQVVIGHRVLETWHQVPPTWGQIKRLVSEEEIVRRHGGDLTADKLFIAMLAVLSCQVSPVYAHSYWVYLPDRTLVPGHLDGS